MRTAGSTPAASDWIWVSLSLSSLFWTCVCMCVCVCVCGSGGGSKTGPLDQSCTSSDILSTSALPVLFSEEFADL